MEDSDITRASDRMILVNALRVRFEDMAGGWVA